MTIPKFIVSIYQHLRYDMKPEKVTRIRWPYDADQFKPVKSDVTISRLDPEPIYGSLKAPRWYSSTTNQIKRDRIAGLIDRDSDRAIYLASFSRWSEVLEILEAWVDDCWHPEDGGSISDYFLARHEGDTPILIASRFCKFGIAFIMLENSKGTSSFAFNGRFKRWWRRYADYILDYVPVQLNNHYSWRAYFLMLSGLILRDEELWSKGVSAFRIALKNQFNEEWLQTFELERKDDAQYYSAMNLEALRLCDDLLWHSNGGGECGFQKGFSGILYHPIDAFIAWNTDKRLSWVSEVVTTEMTESLPYGAHALFFNKCGSTCLSQDNTNKEIK